MLTTHTSFLCRLCLSLYFLQNKAPYRRLYNLWNCIKKEVFTFTNLSIFIPWFVLLVQLLHIRHYAAATKCHKHNHICIYEVVWHFSHCADRKTAPLACINLTSRCQQWPACGAWTSGQTRSQWPLQAAVPRGEERGCCWPFLEVVQKQPTFRWATSDPGRQMHMSRFATSGLCSGVLKCGWDGKTFTLIRWWP